jgi:long-chain acyl-CoA synthetase
MNLAWFLERAGRLSPDSPAIFVGEGLHSRYGEFASRAASIATAIRTDLGLEPGARIGISMPNRPEFLEVLYGAWWAGCAVVPIDARLHPVEQAYILQDSGALVCFAGGGLAASLGALGMPVREVTVIDVTSRRFAALLESDEARVTDVAAGDLAWLFYTSGTTGRPKGAMLSHRNLLQMALAYFADIEDVSPRDAVIHAAPLSHGSGLYHLPHVLKRARQVIPESEAFNPSEVFGLIERQTGASLFVAPTMVKRLVDAPEAGSTDTSKLATMVYGGGPMYLKDCIAALDVFGPKLSQIYGQGESPMTITGLSKSDHANTRHPRYFERLGSVGTPRSVVEVAVGEVGRFLPPGEVGEVLVRGDVVMAGYWKQPAATADALAGGWLHTGDVGSFDSDGFLTLRDRSKDLIITGGNNVYPREVEEVLLRVPGVAEVAVVGRPDAEWGETIVAFVVAQGRSPDASELDAACLGQLARYKRPREYRFVAALPKNSYGKVLKKELRGTLTANEGVHQAPGS